jgi:hypothetical protein
LESEVIMFFCGGDLSSQLLNTIGLIFNIGGVVLLFFFGPPQPSFEEGIGLGLEDGNVLEDGKTVAEHNVYVRKNKKTHEILSRFSLVLLIIGFGFQLIANIDVF